MDVDDLVPSVVGELYAELGHRPDVVLVIVGRDVWKQIESELHPLTRHCNVTLYDAGFDNLLVRGVPVTYSESDGGRMMLTKMP